MTGTWGVRPDVVKEIKGLFPVWLGMLLAMVAGAVLGVTALAVAAYLLGAVLLGTQAVGGEYGHRTLGLLLSQPVSRQRILAVKLGVLAVMLLGSLLVWIVLPEAGVPWAHRRGLLPAMAVAGPLCALTLAPWFTMVCRSGLAGLVFTIATPAAILIAGDLIGVALYGAGAAADIDRFKTALFWPVLLTLCAAAAAGSWRAFARLELIDGPGAEVALGGGLRGRSPAAWDPATEPRWRSGPLRQLVRKELRLQQMSGVVGILYVLAWMAIALVKRLAPATATMGLETMSLLALGLLCVLIGALASAEERQLGTLDSQNLLPVAAWRQWSIKVGVVIGLALLLAVALPAVLWRANPLGLPLDPLPPLWMAVPGVLLVTSGSLYVSTFNTGGVKAMVWALPFLFAVAISVQGLSMLWWTALRNLYEWKPGWVGVWSVLVPFIRTIPLIAAAAIVPPLLYAGFRNHRSSERGAVRMVKQLLAVAAFAPVATLLVIALSVAIASLRE